MQSPGNESLATVHCASFPNEVFPASGGWLSEQTEAQTGDVPIKLRVSNPKGFLRAGMSVQVELDEPPAAGIAIPEVAVTVDEGGGRMVTVIRDGKAVPTKIVTATEEEPEVCAGQWIRVLSGLSVGDEVAIENGYALPAGTPVQVLPPLSARVHGSSSYQNEPLMNTATIPLSGMSRFVVRHSKAVLFLTACVCLLGGLSAVTMPASIFPRVDFPRVVILIDNGVMPGDEMMAAVTRPIEEAMKDIPGVVSVRSATGRGSAEVNVFF